MVGPSRVIGESQLRGRPPTKFFNSIFVTGGIGLHGFLIPLQGEAENLPIVGPHNNVLTLRHWPKNVIVK